MKDNIKFCKLYNIEPYYWLHLYSGDALVSKDMLDDYVRDHACDLDKYLKDIKAEAIKEGPVYPNMKTGDNFVKLYNLAHKQCVSGEVILFYDGKNAVNSLIKQLIRFHEQCNKLKESIKKEKFNYYL